MAGIKRVDFEGPCLLFLGSSLEEPWQFYQTAERDRGVIAGWWPVVFPSSRDADKAALQAAERLSSTEDLARGFTLHYLILAPPRGQEQLKFIRKKVTIHERVDRETNVEIVN